MIRSIINDSRDLINAIYGIETEINNLEELVRKLRSAKATITQPTNNQLLTWDEQLSMVVDSEWQLPAADGAANEILYTDGAGNLGWIAPGVAAVAGADTQVQYNLAGAMGAEAAFTYNYNTNTLTVDNMQITGLTAGYLPYDNAGTIDDSLIYYNGTDIGISTIAPLGRLDVSYARQTLYIGADESTITRTDNTNKRCHIGMPQYDTDEPGMGIIAGYCTVAANTLWIGTGGSTGLNAATQINLATAANTTALPATWLSIANDGTITINQVADAGTDTDEFLVRDANNNIDSRTGAELLSDLSGDASAAFDWNAQDLENVGNIEIDSDSDALILGEDQDAEIYYDGTNLRFDSQLVGAGNFYFENGNVGINETSPEELLHITDTNDHPKIMIEGNTKSTIHNTITANREILYIRSVSTGVAAGGQITLYGGGDSTYPDSVHLQGGGASTLCASGNNRVGVNEVNPDTILHITDTSSTPYITLEGNCQSRIFNYVLAGREILGIAANTDSANGSQISLYGDGDSSLPGAINFITNNTSQFRIINNGNIYAYNLDSAAGTDLIITGADEICIDSSALRFKEKISDFNIDSRVLQNFKLHEFTWKDTKEISEDIRGERDFGFIADELAKTFPGIETYNKGKIQAWNKKKMIELLVAEVQRLNKEVELLKAA